MNCNINSGTNTKSAVTSLKRYVYKIQQHNRRWGKKYEAVMLCNFEIMIYSDIFNSSHVCKVISCIESLLTLVKYRASHKLFPQAKRNISSLRQSESPDGHLLISTVTSDEDPVVLCPIQRSVDVINFVCWT